FPAALAQARAELPSRVDAVGEDGDVVGERIRHDGGLAPTMSLERAARKAPAASRTNCNVPSRTGARPRHSAHLPRQVGGIPVASFLLIRVTRLTATLLAAIALVASVAVPPGARAPTP